jgi:hypothetical protein
MDMRRIECQCKTCRIYDIGYKGGDFCSGGMNMYYSYPCNHYAPLSEREKTMESPRYYVFNPKKDIPVQLHLNITDAENEAKRIAEKEPDTEILVVRAIVGITYPSKGYIYRNYKK